MAPNGEDGISVSGISRAPYTGWQERTPVLSHGAIDMVGSDKTPGEGPARQKSVLIVEDNELNMKLFNDLLEANGYKVIQTRDGLSAL